MSSVTDYLNACRSESRTPGTTEPSYYPHLAKLLDDHTEAAVKARTERRDAGSNKPDLGLYESGADVLYVEAKLPHVTVDELLQLDQGRRYAEALGGLALLTNLNDFVLARLDGARLVAQHHVRLFAGEIFGEKKPQQNKQASEDLQRILAVGCALHQTIRDPSKAANLLATQAKGLAQVLPIDSLEPIKSGFKNWLGTEIADDFLASTAVQAIVYGMFATWLESDFPDNFKWQDVRDRPLNVGAIADIVYAALPPPVANDPEVRSLLEGTAGVLRRFDRKSISEQFDNRAIEYFYEPFLAAYNPKLRDKLGVWYTPSEIAAYQVARANHHLKEDLGIAAGLADESVIVLDPAVGTGTYLAAVYDHLHAGYSSQGIPPSLAAEMVREAAKTRLVGFDVLLASLLICDLHLRRRLHRFGAPLEPSDRPSVYLTNSLSGWFTKDDPAQMSLLWTAAEREVEAANKYKRDERVLVMLGNPPYDGYSSAATPEEENLIKPWKAILWPEWGVKKSRIDDLYVRFWAAAVKRIAEITRTGVISFITNRKWLSGRSFPAMRGSLLADFDKVVIDDLGSDSRGEGGGSGDESIFATQTTEGVQVGTAIVTAVRLPESTGGRAGTHNGDPASTTVFHRELSGTASDKRHRLDLLRDDGIDSGLGEWRTSRKTRWKLGGSETDEAWAGLDEYFEFKNSAVQPVRDLAVIDHDKAALEKRMDDYFNPELSWADLVQRHPAFGIPYSGYNGEIVRKNLHERNSSSSRVKHDPKRLVKCLWKPLYPCWLYWEPDHKLLNRPRPDLIPYWSIPEQLSLVSTQTRRRANAARPLVTAAVPILEAMDPTARVLPLWSPSEVTQVELSVGDASKTGSGKEANINGRWIIAARSAGVPGSDNEIAEIIFFAICGVAASEEWCATQPVEYDDYPTIPIPSDAQALASATSVGRAYAALVDPFKEVEGVTKQPLRDDLLHIAEPDSVQGADPVLKYGTSGSLGGGGGEAGRRNSVLG